MEKAAALALVDADTAAFFGLVAAQIIKGAVHNAAHKVQPLCMVALQLSAVTLVQPGDNYRDILVGFTVINDRVALGKLVKVQKNAMQVILHSVTEPAHTTGASAPRSGPSIGSPG